MKKDHSALQEHHFHLWYHDTERLEGLKGLLCGSFSCSVMKIWIFSLSFIDIFSYNIKIYVAGGVYDASGIKIIMNEWEFFWKLRNFGIEVGMAIVIL